MLRRLSGVSLHVDGGPGDWWQDRGDRASVGIEVDGAVGMQGHAVLVLERVAREDVVLMQGSRPPILDRQPRTIIELEAWDVIMLMEDELVQAHQ